MSEDSKLVPPYVAFEPLLTFISQLNKTVVPAVIDKGMMSSMSGATQSHLMSAMRSLGLLDFNDAATMQLRELVEDFGTEAWPNTLKAVIESYYIRILGEVDITTASAKQVRDKFKDAGFDGSMADRAIRFFIKAMEEAKMTFSPHIKMRKKGIRKGTRPSRATTDQAKATPSTDTPVTEHPASVVILPKGMIRYPLHFRRATGAVEGMLMVPEDITEADCKLIEAQLAVLKIYATPSRPPLPDL